MLRMSANGVLALRKLRTIRGITGLNTIPALQAPSD